MDNFRYNFSHHGAGLPYALNTHGTSPVQHSSGSSTIGWNNMQNGSGDIQSFENLIPADASTPKGSLKTGPQPAREGSFGPSISSLHRKTLIKTLLWPVLIITIPIALLSATLLALVFGYHVKSRPSLFAPEAGNGQDPQYVLVNYPATRLVFAASFLSTVAPILGSFIMMLWSLRVAQSMRSASVEGHHTQLPTPYQLSLIIGITLASTDRLRRYFGYLLSTKRPSIPPVLHHAAMMFTGSIIIAVGVFLSDTALHYFTSTISFDAITHNQQPAHEYGRGLSQYCLDFNRTENLGFPCSYNLTVQDPNAEAEVNEIFYLQHNNSRKSEIQLLQNDKLAHGDLAILVPQMQNVAADVDYRASTVGVATQCYPITQKCNMRVANDVDWDYTEFNCSKAFFGVLGKAPNISELSGASQDPDVPALGYKPATNLQYGFFTDSDLSNPYNPEEYNATTEQPALQAFTDTPLINPMYLGLAGRIAFSSLVVGNRLSNDSGVFNGEHNGGQNSYYDLALECPVTAFDIQYTWANGRFQDVSFSPSPNGSMLEMYHARQFYISVSSGDYDLQDYLLQAAMQSTSEDLAREWANLYSSKVLATIGAYTTPRTDILEQNRAQLLVARVPKAALGALIACSLAYTVLGITLGFAAYRASATDVRDLAAQLSLAGLTAAAFDERKTYNLASGGATPKSNVFSEKYNQQETRRVLIDGSPETGYDFRVWM